MFTIVKKKLYFDMQRLNWIYSDVKVTLPQNIHENGDVFLLMSNR